MRELLRVRLFCFALTFSLIQLCLPLQGAEKPLQDSILARLPAETPFVSISRLQREQLQAILAHPFIQQCLDNPECRELFRQVMNDEEGLGGIIQFWNSLGTTPEGQEVQWLLQDLASHELFLYGDPTWLDAPQAVAEMQKLADVSIEDQKPDSGDLNVDEEKYARLLKQYQAVPQEIYDRIQIPNLVFGAKSSDSKRAGALFDQLITLWEQFRENDENEIPQNYLDLVSVQTINNQKFLTLKIPGRWIPTYLLDRSRMTQSQEELIDFFLDGLARRSFTVALGMREDQILVSLGGSLDHLEQQPAENSLLDLPEFQPLQEQADASITSVSYRSKAFTQLGWTKENIQETFADYAEQIRNSIKDEQDEQKKVFGTRMANDILELGQDLQTFRTEPAAALSFSLMQENAWERIHYDWSEHPERNGTAPLDILKQIGTGHALVYAQRRAYRPEVFEFRQKWANRIWWYVTSIAAQAEAQELNGYMFIANMFRPTLRELATTTKELWIPAFEDGQSALVLSVRELTDNDALPAALEQFPSRSLPQVAWMSRITDQQKLLDACNRYRKALNDVGTMLGAAGDDGQPVSIPAP
ncbi:MAG: hypothetical protein KDA78_05495, partial [Planctomycetaceae bacterium]|nr:hypothetical protein [Planctomycetaceae bacterium]